MEVVGVLGSNRWIRRKCGLESMVSRDSNAKSRLEETHETFIEELGKKYVAVTSRSFASCLSVLRPEGLC